MDQKIINFVRTHKYLYDKTDQSYKDTTLKEKKWKQLSEEIDIPVDLIKKRWKVMRDRYLRVLKQNYYNNGHRRQTKYKYYDLLSFLGEGRNYSRSSSNYMELVEDRTSTESAEPPYNSITEHSVLDNFLGKFYKASSPESEAPITEIIQVPNKIDSSDHFDDNEIMMDDTKGVYKEQTPQTVETPISCHMRGLGLLLEAANWSSERLLTFQTRHTMFILNELKK